MFSFNGPHGACPTCDGLGARTVVDPERVVGEPNRTLREGVVLAWGRRGSVALATEVARAVQVLGVGPDTPWESLADEHRSAILFGTGDAAKTKRGGKKKSAYEGIVTRLTQRLESGSPDVGEGDDADLDEGCIADDELGRFVTTRTCDACQGRRLRPEALAVKLGRRDISELGRLPLRKLRSFVASLGSQDADEPFSPRETAIAEPLLRAVAARLGFLIDVGLDYLSLDRSAQTLSSGEGQRIRLATQIGAALVGVLYVLDEPSVGLHARDNARLIEAQVRLRDLGNTVLVVEHDREAILAADHVVDMGPGAGVHGGKIVSQGSAQEIMDDPESITGPGSAANDSSRSPNTARARARPRSRWWARAPTTFGTSPRRSRSGFLRASRA
jgi:excinuclease ABC subunit A